METSRTILGEELYKDALEVLDSIDEDRAKHGEARQKLLADATSSDGTIDPEAVKEADAMYIQTLLKIGVPDRLNCLRATLARTTFSSRIADEADKQYLEENDYTNKTPAEKLIIANRLARNRRFIAGLALKHVATSQTPKKVGVYGKRDDSGLWLDIEDPRGAQRENPTGNDKVVASYEIAEIVERDDGSREVTYYYPASRKPEPGVPDDRERKVQIIPPSGSVKYRVNGGELELYIPNDRASIEEVLSTLQSYEIERVMLDPTSGVTEPWFRQDNVLGEPAMFTNPDNWYSDVPVAKSE